MKKMLFFISFIIILSSCKNMWSDEDKNAYMQSCLDDADKWAGSAEKAKTVCTCRLDILMKKYSDAGEVLEHIDTVMKDNDLAACGGELDKK